MGVSVHSLAEAVIAAEDGADYCLFGHLFPTNRKKGIQEKRTNTRRNCAKSRHSCLAIGGITPDNMTEVAVKKSKWHGSNVGYLFCTKSKRSSKTFRKERD